ncbi:MAG: N-acetyltransferase [Proteobacteria bacterium]|nr:N-acetyltransferase [Pseudomonadota bacterium]
MLRKAKISDVKGIHALIDIYAKAGEMLPCALVDLYERVRDFYVYTDDENGELLGVCALHICWEDLGEIRSLAVKGEERLKGIGKIMALACLEEAALLGLKKVFALTYKPDFFKRMKFIEIDKGTLPHKIWGDCIKCSKFPDCDETAMMVEL